MADCSSLFKTWSVGHHHNIAYSRACVNFATLIIMMLIFFTFCFFLNVTTGGGLDTGGGGGGGGGGNEGGGGTLVGKRGIDIVFEVW